MNLGDDELATLSAMNDRAAFGVIVTRHQGVVRGFLRRLVQEEATADDIAQEAFITAYQKIGAYRGPGRLRSWLLSIAYRKFLAHRRRSRRWAMLGGFFATRDEPVADARYDGATADDATPALEDQVIDAVALTNALDQLGGAEREAILLCDVYGFSRTEAAALMGAPLGTVKSHVTRGRSRLRALLVDESARS